MMVDFKEFDVEWELIKVDKDYFDLHIVENHFPENLLLFNLYLADEGQMLTQEKAAKVMYNLHKITKDIKDYRIIFAGILGKESKLVCLTKPDYDYSVLTECMMDTLAKIERGEVVYSSDWGEYFHKNNLGGTSKFRFIDEYGNEAPTEQITSELKEDIQRKYKRVSMIQIFYNDNPDIKTRFVDIDGDFLTIIKKLHEELKQLHK